MAIITDQAGYRVLAKQTIKRIVEDLRACISVPPTAWSPRVARLRLGDCPAARLWSRAPSGASWSMRPSPHTTRRCDANVIANDG